MTERESYELRRALLAIGKEESAISSHLPDAGEERSRGYRTRMEAILTVHGKPHRRLSRGRLFGLIAAVAVILSFTIASLATVMPIGEIDNWIDPELNVRWWKYTGSEAKSEIETVYCLSYIPDGYTLYETYIETLDSKIDNVTTKYRTEDGSELRLYQVGLEGYTRGKDMKGACEALMELEDHAVLVSYWEDYCGHKQQTACYYEVDGYLIIYSIRGENDWQELRRTLSGIRPMRENEPLQKVRVWEYKR